MYDSPEDNSNLFVDIATRMQSTVLEQQTTLRDMERERELMCRELELMRRERDLLRREMSANFEDTMSPHSLQRDVAEKLIPAFDPSKETGLNSRRLD